MEFQTIRQRVHTEPEHKTEANASGNLNGREVEIQKTTCWQWLINQISILFPAPSPYLEIRYDSHHHYQSKKLNPEAINQQTEICIQRLQNSPLHKEILFDWVVEIYNAHEHYLYKNGPRGTSFMESEAAICVDKLLNPVLLQEIEKLIPHSEEARVLQEQAITKKMPLADLVLNYSL